MASEKTLGIILRTVDFSETSSIVTIYTRDFGKIGALAKGARRPKSSFEVALDLLSVCRIVVIQKSADVLDLLTEAKLERRFRGAEYGLDHVYAGLYFVELLDQLTDNNDKNPQLFELCDQSLMLLSQQVNVRAIILRYEMSLLRLIGHQPSFSLCAGCGNNVPLTNRVSFGLVDGGVLCQKCRVNRSNLISVSAGVLKTLDCYADYRTDHWTQIQPDAKSHGELRAVVNRYYWHLLGRKPKLHSYMDLLNI